MGTGDNSLVRAFWEFRDAFGRFLDRQGLNAAEPAVAAAPGEERRHSSDRRRRGAIASSWLTVDETVAYLGLPSRKALYQAIRRGTLPVHRIGRCLRFLRTELDAHLQQK